MGSAPNFAMSPATRVAAVKDQVYCDIDREAVILHLKTGIYYRLNEVGARVWALLQQARPVAEIAATIAAEFDVSSEHCPADVRMVLEQFHSAGLIEVVDERA